jgi:predicted aldo/keto reductase-like oxidoreductase
VVIQSKCGVNLGARAVGPGMERSLTESLKALKTDYLDVLLIHGADSIETIRHPDVMEFFAAAKKRGQIRASGFSVHVNQRELLKAAVSDGFYDVIMLPYNHRGKFVHSNSGRRGEWDQPALEAELRAAIAKGLGVIAMKTCSGGPYARPGEPKPSFGSAVRWILGRDCIHTSAVAMASFEQVEEDLKSIP